MQDRQKYNKLILEKVSKIIQEEPDLRFTQILFALDIIRSEDGVIKDTFHEESKETYLQLKKL